jgi:predicted transcriptional regulator
MDPDDFSASPRVRVETCVRDHPGAHLRDIARRCRLPLGTALYHLDRLESEGAFAVRRDGRYKRYYEATAIGRQEKDVLCALRHATPRRIVLAILAAGPATQRELAAALRLSRSTLSFHASGLARQGLLRRIESRPERRYDVAEPWVARALLERYRASLATADDEALYSRLQEAPALAEGVA